MEETPDLICITESWANANIRDGKINMNGYKVSRRDIKNRVDVQRRHLRGGGGWGPSPLLLKKKEKKKKKKEIREKREKRKKETMKSVKLLHIKNCFFLFFQ